MFSEVCAILFTGGGGTPLPPRQPTLEGIWDQTGSDMIHPPVLASSAGSAAVGPHCTGMHSCLPDRFAKSRKKEKKVEIKYS